MGREEDGVCRDDVMRSAPGDLCALLIRAKRNGRRLRGMKVVGVVGVVSGQNGIGLSGLCGGCRC